jgi:thiol-disulfide isomerase/thioredoxin
MMKSRRTWLFGSAAAAAALGGAGWSWWRQQPAEGLADAGLWTLRFERPSGGELVMAELRGQPIVINFWATWCAPCVREMPQLDRFYRDFAGRGWRVVGLALDRREPVQTFLRSTPVSFDIGLAGALGTDLVRRLGNEAGGLPFSVMLAPNGRIVQRKLGETSYDELAGWAKAL